MLYRNLYSLLLIGLSCLLSVAGLAATSSQIDSVGIERRNGEIFVRHMIDQGQTLFSISRQYEVSVQEIKELNPERDVNQLAIGDTLRIPMFPTLSRGQKVLHIVQEGETLYRLAREYEVTTDNIKSWNALGTDPLKIGQSIVIYQPLPEKEKPDPERYVTHQVEEGETLYAIARAYQEPLVELMKRNELTTENIKLGQTLIICEKNPIPVPVVNVEPTASTVSTPRRISRNEALRQEKERYERIRREEEETIASYKKVSSNGFASVIEGHLNTQKFLALHRSAPVGTILRVRNEMNDVSIFVRVVGKLPDTGVNNKLEIRLTQSAYDKLGGINERFPVEITYIE